MKWKNKKDICLINTFHDKMAPTRVRGQDMEKPKVVIDYNSGMRGVDLSDTYLTSYHSTRKRLKNTLLPQCQNKIHVSAMLCATKRVSVTKQGTALKTVEWFCVLHPVSNITIWWLNSRGMKGD
jgi:hypothetical protein